MVLGSWAHIGVTWRAFNCPMPRTAQPALRVTSGTTPQLGPLNSACCRKQDLEQAWRLAGSAGLRGGRGAFRRSARGVSSASRGCWIPGGGEEGTQGPSGGEFLLSFGAHRPSCPAEGKW